MEAYKYETVVLENGVIQIPELEKFKNMKVEIFVVPATAKKRKSKKEPTEKSQSIEEFLEKWSGFAKADLSEDALEDIRYQAIMEKHK